MNGSVTYSSTLNVSNLSFKGQVSSLHAQVVADNVTKKAQALSFIQSSRDILFNDLLKRAKKRLNAEKNEMIKRQIRVLIPS